MKRYAKAHNFSCNLFTLFRMFSVLRRVCSTEYSLMIKAAYPHVQTEYLQFRLMDRKHEYDSVCWLNYIWAPTATSTAAQATAAAPSTQKLITMRPNNDTPRRTRKQMARNKMRIDERRMGALDEEERTEEDQKKNTISFAIRAF